MSEESTLDEFASTSENSSNEWSEEKLRNLIKKDEAGVWGDESSGNGVRVLRATNYAPNNIDLSDVAVRDIPDSKKNSKELKSGDIVVERSGGSADQPVGRVLFFDLEGEYYHGNFLRQLRPDTSKINSRYLYYRLDYDYRRGHTKPLQTNTTNIRNLQYSSYLNQNIPTPSKSQQRKIATILYTVDQVIEKTGEIIDRVMRVREGLHQTLFRDWSEATDIDPLAGRYPTDWELKTLSDVVTVTDAEHFTPDYVESGIPVLRPGDLIPGQISLENVEKRVDEETYEELTNRHTPSSDDIVYSRSQNFAVASQVIENKRFCLGQDMVVIEPGELNETFLLHLLNSPVVRNQAVRRSTGSTFSRVNLGDIRSYKIPIPPNEVQQQIAEITAGVEERIRVEKENKKRLKRLKRGLQQDLLSGTVRTTDTNIEVPDEIAQHG